MTKSARLFSVVVLLSLTHAGGATEPQWSDLGSRQGDEMLEAYFRAETAELTRAALNEVKTLDDWKGRKDRYRQQLFEMLGLDPLPEKTPLEATITGTTEHAEFVVETLHFQSRPNLYVTANLYVPKECEEPLPAILYVCGHGRVKADGISYGNKAAYQHHGGWFARNGYVCLTIDTLQLGEIEGIHHGTYREKMWWWNSRGYTSAGVEAWNCIRALDYLQSRPEVAPDRIGVTGRSGGGAYSWWISALDDRIKVAVPVAGITSLHNHVVDGCVEGHCDCMYMVNTYRWDFPMVAALVAPRPLLISNTDKDRIFPLDGVVDVYDKAKRIYKLHDKVENIGLHVCEGPHKDTQELRIHAFHWFNQHLKGEDPLIETAAVKLFQPPELRVFEELPEDERNTRIQDTFTEVASPTVPKNVRQWQDQKKRWMAALRKKVFRGWPSPQPAAHGDLSVLKTSEATEKNLCLSVYEFKSESPGIVLKLYWLRHAQSTAGEPDAVLLHALDQEAWNEFLATLRPAFSEPVRNELVEGEDMPEGNPNGLKRLTQKLKGTNTAFVYVAPRGIGPTAWNPGERKQTQIRRRFMLLGQTRDGMRVWDVARAAAAVRRLFGDDLPLRMKGARDMAGIVLYAAVFTPNVQRVELSRLPASHQEAPIFLNVLRFLDVPQAVAMVAEQTQTVVHDSAQAAWQYARQVSTHLDWDPRQIVTDEQSEQSH
ncbi:MAG: alpha/beta hydrolase family protein [Planctomycetota bacterium]